MTTPLDWTQEKLANELVADRSEGASLCQSSGYKPAKDCLRDVREPDRHQGLTV